MVFFAKLAEAEPTESGVFCRSGIPALIMERMEKNPLNGIFTTSQFVSTACLFAFYGNIGLFDRADDHALIPKELDSVS
jgi:hypothetical protein